MVHAPDLFGDDDPASRAYDASAIEVLEGLEPVRKRPGMYIGGTDERALHHLVAEVLDNAMDEAVAGHANRIEVELARRLLADGPRQRPRHAGRPAPALPGQVGAGGDPLHAACRRQVLRQGLPDLGRPARRRRLGGQRALRPAGGRGGAQPPALAAGLLPRPPAGPLQALGPAPNRRGTTVTFHPDAGDLRRLGAHFKPARLLRMVRSKAYLFSGVEIRWRCAPACLAPGDDTPEAATFHFPGGLSDYLAERLDGAQCYADRAFAGKVDFAERFGAGTVGSVEWAINWTPQRDAFVSSYCNTIPTPEGGTHEQGFWAAILKGIRAYGELASNRKAAQITREDVMAGGSAMISVFIREPEFVGQTKDRLATQEAARLVEGAVRDRFDNWLAADTRTAGAILDYLVLKAEERLRRRAEKETSRKTAVKKLRLPGKLADCSGATRDGSELFLVEGDSRGRLGQAGARPQDPGGAAAPGQDPERAGGGVVEADAEPGAGRPLPGDGGAGRLAVRARRPALREDHHHDRRRRRRRAHRLAADDLLLHPDEAADRRGAPLPRGAAALPADPGGEVGLRARRRREGRGAGQGARRARQGRGVALQGPGRDDAGAAQGDHDEPGDAGR